MDPKIVSRFNERILRIAMDRYGIESSNIRLLDGFESFIYKFQRSDGHFILRIGHSGRRSPNLICGEVDWINYLASEGASVARAILSNDGNLVELVSDDYGENFLCTAFIEASGGPVRRDRMNEGFIRNYGKLLGRMHTLAKTYTVSNLKWRRYEWDSPENTIAESQMPKTDTVVLEKYRNILAHLRDLPRSREGFGMIHQDAHLGNFFVDDNDGLTLFDFDDCVFGHFIYDIAMVLFYASIGEPDPVEHTRRFMPIFFLGYREENRLDPFWLAELPYFMKLREIDLFAAIQFSFADDDISTHPWSARYMQGRRERIEMDVPFIDFDWSCLVEYL